MNWLEGKGTTEYSNSMYIHNIYIYRKEEIMQ